METLLSWFEFLRDPIALVTWGGYVGLTLIVFTETGLLIGFFLPGDSLLVTAGLLAANPKLGLNILVLNLLLIPAAIIGDAVGYTIGRRAGRPLFDRPDSRFFKRRNVEKAQRFFDKHGPKTIVLARFVPFVRTFAPIVAGVGRMHYPTFAAYNVLGGLLWGVGLTLVGFLLGEAFDVDRYLLPIIAAIVVASLIPVAREALKARRVQ